MAVLEHSVTLDFPIPTKEKGKSISSVVAQRPAARDIADFILLIGGKEIAEFLKETISQDGKPVTEADLKNIQFGNDLIEQLGGLIKPEFFDGAFDLLSRLLGISKEHAERLAPEDLAKIFQECAPVFFPKLFSATASTGEA